MSYYEKKVLVINPNTTEAMTQGLKPLVDKLRYKNVSVPKIIPITPTNKMNPRQHSHTSPPPPASQV
ncbi:hypothetical protein HII31_13701 [Pseudocercospora fuligena]|uniref:Uncharacterized protein n=1 Tax=Pseudocercospora fuligena TaxID=685502 RepID=A0A8H6R5Q4_9PEZI|nr:hypothetical protein HII31_13701 [Pseudocercospora fuligena]